MSVIKQISIFNGSNWDTPADIGANAGNIDIATSAGSTTNIAGSSNLYTGLTNILPASRLTANTALISGPDQKITSSSVTSAQLEYLSGTTTNIQTALNTLNTNFTNIDNINFKVQIIPNSGSFNSPDGTGVWYMQGVTNQSPIYPIAGWGLLFQMRTPKSLHPTSTGAVYTQTFISTGGNLYTRSFVNNSWTDWARLINDITTGTVTMKVAGTSNLVVRQYEHTITIYGYIDGMSLSANTPTDIAQISGVILPANVVRVRGAVGTTAYSVGNDAYIAINTTGIINVTPSTSGRTIYFNAAYIR